MRRIEEKEMRTLLRAAACGRLDRNDLGEICNDAEPVYAEAIRQEDGSAIWSLHHYPYTDEERWRWYKEGISIFGEPRANRENIVELTKEEKATIIKACAKGEIEECDLPRIYPLKVLPQIVAMVFVGYMDDWKSAPGLADELLLRALPRGITSIDEHCFSEGIDEIFLSADRRRALLAHHEEEKRKGEDASELLRLMDYGTGEMVDVPRYLTEGYCCMECILSPRPSDLENVVGK